MSSRHDLRTSICDLLGCDGPILLAGMSGVNRKPATKWLCWEAAANLSRQ
jgi:hypothetical protein